VSGRDRLFEKRGDRPDVGPWKAFKEDAYPLSQTSFTYLLLDGRNARSLAGDTAVPWPIKLRFGSKGDDVGLVQERLDAAGFPVGVIDGDFGRRTLFAVLEFQTARFGADADDGIVGPAYRCRTRHRCVAGTLGRGGVMTARRDLCYRPTNHPFDAHANTYYGPNALCMAVMSNLAYENKAKIERQTARWGIDRFHFSPKAGPRRSLSATPRK
jgi:peptidoglycan hydrolase-like protein with peptidoglycan-binding domain